MFINKVEQPVAMHDQHLRVLTGKSSGSAGAAVKERKLANHIALLIFRENDLLSFGALNKQLNLAAAEDKNLPSGITVVKDGFAFFEVAAIHHLGQRFTFFVVKQPEDGDISDHGHGCGHGVFISYGSQTARALSWAGLIGAIAMRFGALAQPPFSVT